jgi:gas vesicle protein
MSQISKIEENEPKCLGKTGIGSKLMFLLVGGGLGAVIALLLAPKPGRELRQDIADAAVKGYDETLDAANRVKEQAVEYYETVKEAGDRALDVVAERVSILKDEVADDAAKISGVIGNAAERVANTGRPRQIF